CFNMAVLFSFNISICLFKSAIRLSRLAFVAFRSSLSFVRLALSVLQLVRSPCTVVRLPCDCLYFFELTHENKKTEMVNRRTIGFINEDFVFKNENTLNSKG